MHVENPVKIAQYADDGVVSLSDEAEFETVLDMISKFGNVAGTLINKTKCEGLWLGNYKHRQQNCTLHGIKWPEEPIRCLGIYV